MFFLNFLKESLHCNLWENRHLDLTLIPVSHTPSSFDPFIPIFHLDEIFLWGKILKGYMSGILAKTFHVWACFLLSLHVNSQWFPTDSSGLILHPQKSVTLVTSQYLVSQMKSPHQSSSVLMAANVLFFEWMILRFSLFLGIHKAWGF